MECIIHKKKHYFFKKTFFRIFFIIYSKFSLIKSTVDINEPKEILQSILEQCENFWIKTLETLHPHVEITNFGSSVTDWLQPSKCLKTRLANVNIMGLSPSSKPIIKISGLPLSTEGYESAENY